MNRFVIVDGLPYLYSDDGKIYSVRWDAEGFTVGAEVEIAPVPAVVYSEVSILAKCAGNLDSIKAEEIKTNTKAEEIKTNTTSRRKKAVKE